jgi:hypothetical protein
MLLAPSKFHSNRSNSLLILLPYRRYIASILTDTISSQFKYLPIFFLPLASLFGNSFSYCSSGLIIQFLDLSQAVGLLGRVISSSQGLYLNTNTEKLSQTSMSRVGFKPRVRASEDSSCFRPRGHCDQH